MSLDYRLAESVPSSTLVDANYRGEDVSLRSLDRRSRYGLPICLKRPEDAVLPQTACYPGSGASKRLYDPCEPNAVTVGVSHDKSKADETVGQLGETSAESIEIGYEFGTATASIAGL